MEKTSQANRLYFLLADGKPHRTDEIMEKVYGGSHLGIARIGARIADLKARGHDIRGWKDSEVKSLYYYQIIPRQVVSRVTTPQMALFN